MNTPYGQNISLVGLTKQHSCWIMLGTACITIVIGLFPEFIGILSSIPDAVLGGISVVLYGFIAVSGIKMMVTNQIDLGNPKNMIVVSVILVLALGGATISFATQNGNITITSMGISVIAGIVCNLLLRKRHNK